MDELEWRRENAKLGDAERDQGVTDLIELVAGVDAILEAQADRDAAYFIGVNDRVFCADEQRKIEAAVLAAYRWQYIGSGVQDGRFLGILTSMITEAQLNRIVTALTPLM